ncbi:MAG: glycosyltransferase [Acetatifactor sp.]|nr:glycosyltransferase [Acetatifactor sp.]
MIRVLIIITTGFSQYGGLASVVMNYLRNIDFTDLKIDILSLNEPEEELLNECRTLGIKYIRLSGRSKNPIGYMLSLKRILKQYDVAHINANSATAAIELMAAKMAGVQNRIVHNHTAKCDHVVAHKILVPIYKRLYTDAIACSSRAGDWIFGPNNFLILNNSIDTDKYSFSELSRSKIRGQYNISKNTFVVGHVGKIYKPKNHKKILDIFKAVNSKNSQSVLLLVGDGEMRAEIELYAKDCGVDKNVIFAGMQKNTYEYLSALDCFLFPSLWEGMPLALLEAQASGVKCVISDTIDKDVAICKDVIIHSLDDPDDKWADDVLLAMHYDRADACKRNKVAIQSNNYDVHLNANKLREMYIK